MDNYTIIGIIVGAAVTALLAWLATVGPKLRQAALSVAERAARDYAATYNIAKIGVQAAKQRSWEYLDGNRDGAVDVNDWMFQYADRFLSVAAPFLPADSRQALIEAAVAGLNEVGDLIDDLPAPAGNVVAKQVVSVPATD